MVILIEQDIGGLEIAVEDAAGMRVGHRLGRLGHQAGGGAGILLVPLHQGHEAAAGDELHAEVMLAVVAADLVDRDNAGVVEQRHGLGLIAEAAQLVVAGEQAGLDHLQGHGPVERDLAGLIDDTHAPAAQLAPDLIVAEVADQGPAGHSGRGAVNVGGDGRAAGGGGRGRVGVRPRGLVAGRVEVLDPGGGGPVGVGGARPCRHGLGGRVGRAGTRIGAGRAAGARARRRARRELGAATGAAVRIGHRQVLYRR